jgi:hypothetical protein
MQNLDGKIRIVRGNAHWRLDAQYIPIDTAFPEQNSHLARLLEHVERLRLGGFLR